MNDSAAQPDFDVFIIGGGVNGCGIARDAAGRGLRVGLAEAGDLAGGTSSASTKLFHGGLRYLENFELRLVREALMEREVLLRAMPHISWPMRFVLPLSRDLRFAGETPAGRLMATLMPWAKGHRPAWAIRAGLWIYDHLGGRRLLPPTRTVDLANGLEGAPLLPEFARAYEYSDCWVDDSRLVVLNARDAAMRGAAIMVGTRVVSARPGPGGWRISCEMDQRGNANGCRRAVSLTARALVNAGGPWVGQVASAAVPAGGAVGIRLVRGSHIVVPGMWNHDKAYLLQGPDSRVVFALPYEGEFTLVGTTEEEHANPCHPARCSDDERDYLLRVLARYFGTVPAATDVLWSFSGVRPLVDDGAGPASAATRDYRIRLSGDADTPLLTIIGGKITTYRRLAEAALDKLSPTFPGLASTWTATAPLPGGDFPVDGVDGLVSTLCRDNPWLDRLMAERLTKAYGTDAGVIIGGATAPTDLGRHFGAGLYEAELRWMQHHEFARTSEDVLWRRSKLGLRLTAEERQVVADWMQQNPSNPARCTRAA